MKAVYKQWGCLTSCSLNSSVTQVEEFLLVISSINSMGHGFRNITGLGIKRAWAELGIHHIFVG